MSIELPVLNGQKLQDDRPQENCGIVGIIDLSGGESIHRAVAMLSAINHRGSDMAGFATLNHGFHRTRGYGYVKDIFTDQRIQSSHLEGSATIGHTRYKIQGGKTLSFAQPILATHEDRTIALAHNGNVPNTEAMMETLRSRGIRPKKNFDSSLLAQLIVSGEGDDWIEKVQNGLKGVMGSYSLTMLTDDGHLIGVRDPWGNRPLSMAEVDNGVAFASESKAFPMVKGRNRYELNPGQIVDVSKEGMLTSELLEKAQQRTCAFEYIYFAYETSVIGGVTVSTYRKELGASLARNHPGQGTVATAVPESACVMANAYAHERGIPIERLIIKSPHTVGRSFMQGEMGDRVNTIETKFVISPDMEGADVEIEDDSVVIGNTARYLIATTKNDYGAGRVDFRSGSPKLKRDCPWGVNMRSTDGQFIAVDDQGNERSNEEIAKDLGADSVAFPSLPEVYDVATKVGLEPQSLCYECFDGPGLQPAILKDTKPVRKIFTFAD